MTIIWLQELLQRRVNDGSIRRLIGRWLKAGVLDGVDLTYSDEGTPQGGVISPLLANIFLHYVLDEWFVREVQPRLKGRAFLIRFADDFVIGCELEADARRLMEVLPKRFAKHGLTIHPEKTKLIEFGRPRTRPPAQATASASPNTPSASKPGGESGSENGTFDFLGFTHYWTRSRKGYWVIQRRTSRKRMKRRRSRSGTGAGITVICPWRSNTLRYARSCEASTSMRASGATTGRWNRSWRRCGGLGVTG